MTKTLLPIFLTALTGSVCLVLGMGSCASAASAPGEAWTKPVTEETSDTFQTWTGDSRGVLLVSHYTKSYYPRKNTPYENRGEQFTRLSLYTPEGEVVTRLLPFKKRQTFVQALTAPDGYYLMYRAVIKDERHEDPHYLVKKVDRELNLLWEWDSFSLFREHGFYRDYILHNQNSSRDYGASYTPRGRTVLNDDGSLAVFTSHGAMKKLQGVFSNQTELFFTKLSPRGEVLINSRIDTYPDTKEVNQLTILPNGENSRFLDFYIHARSYKKGKSTETRWLYRINPLEGQLLSQDGANGLADPLLEKGRNRELDIDFDDMDFVPERNLAFQTLKGLFVPEGLERHLNQPHIVWDTSVIPWRMVTRRTFAAIPWSRFGYRELRSGPYETLSETMGNRKAHDFRAIGEDLVFFRDSNYHSVPDSASGGLVLHSFQENSLERKSTLFLPLERRPAGARISLFDLEKKPVEIDANGFSGRPFLFNRQLTKRCLDLGDSRYALWGFAQEDNSSDDFESSPISRSLGGDEPRFDLLTIIDLGDIASGREEELSADMVTDIAAFERTSSRKIYPPGSQEN